MNKLHLCCGDVYLKGYENLDIQGTLVEKASPEAIAGNETTLEKYFKYNFGSPRRDVIVDGFLNLNLPWDGIEDDTIDEIVMVSSIEHFTLQEAEFIMEECKRVLKSGGVLKIDFPDVIASIDRYIDERPDFAMQLIYCNHKNEYSVHKWGYVPETFLELLGEGWEDTQFGANSIVKHDYPMIGFTARRVK